jgi:hypothetical protein
MPNLVKKYSISFDLAQKMVAAAVAKATEIGVSENIVILDDGGNLKAFGRMDGAPLPTIEMAQNKAYTALLGVSTQDFFNFIKSDPSLLAGVPYAFAYSGLEWRVSNHGERGSRRGHRRKRGACGPERRRLRERSPGARTRCSAR